MKRGYHMVWVPKYRKKSIYKDLRKYLGVTLKDLTFQKECKIEERRLMSRHTHILISITLKNSMSQLVSFIKSTRIISITRTYLERIF